MRLIVRSLALIGLIQLASACDTTEAPSAPDAGAADATATPDKDTKPQAPACVAALPVATYGKKGGCPANEPAKKDLLDEALAAVKLTRCSAIFSTQYKRPADIWSDAYRLPFFTPIHDTALNAPSFAQAAVGQLDKAAAGTRPVADALMFATHHAGHVGKVCPPTPKIAATHPLATALAALITGAGGRADTQALQTSAASISSELQRALVPIVDALAAAAKARDAALAGVDLGKTATSPGVGLPTLYQYAASLTVRSKKGVSLAPSQKWVETLLQGKAKGFKYDQVYRAAIVVAAAVEDAKLSRFAGAKASLNVATPIGRFILGGPDKDTYDPKDKTTGTDIVFLLDTGGDDIYRIPAGATGSSKNPVSVLVDLGGADTYGYNEVKSPYDGKRLVADLDGRHPGGNVTTSNGPVSLSEVSRQGAARLGIGLLFDLGETKDTYTSLRMSQGFGALGVGVLYDGGGDDIYRGEAAVQGAGVFGIGLLIDQGGSDKYETYTTSQGFGYAKAVGVLYDTAGSDAYLANNGDPAQGGDPLYLSAQLPGKGNSSLVQGMGFGRRADFSDRKFMSGGLGLLRDKAGNDRYEASVFAQGTGYWFGTGVLADGAGDDQYDGLWYVQGATAHYAASVFWDQSGDDKYNKKLEPRATSIGVGHDFSVSWHLDLGGKDDYRAPGLSLGSGNDNGIGFFINAGGDDKYATKGKRTLGGSSVGSRLASSWRGKSLNLGVFVDTGGTDTYLVDGKTAARNNSTWRYKSTNTAGTTTELGVGLDKTGTVATP